jgi:hypothetical protein
MITIEFTFTVSGRERTGILSYSDGLGPITVEPDEETCYTYCAGYSQAGHNAVFLKQAIDSPVEFEILPRAWHEPEELLARFIDVWLPDEGDLRQQVRLLLAEHLRGNY